MSDDLPVQATLWRCAGPCCGKWSFAKRRPTHHRRFVVNLAGDGDADEHGWYPDGSREDGRTRADAAAQAADWELPTVEVRDGGDSWSGDPEETPDPGGVVVKCGPFVEYTAYLRAQWHKDERARAHASQLSAESAEPVPASHYATDTVQFGPGHPPGGTRTTLEQELGTVPF
jgi:hypothetical protein